MNAKQIELTEEAYEELLNEIYEPFRMGSLKFDAGKILKELDPVSFHFGILDEPEVWQCSECRSLYDIEEEAEECCKDNDLDFGSERNFGQGEIN